MTIQAPDETPSRPDAMPIRIAIVSDQPWIPRWVAHAVREAEQDGLGILTTFVHLCQSPPSTPAKRGTAPLSLWSERVYALIERYRFRPNRSYFDQLEVETFDSRVDIVRLQGADSGTHLAAELSGREVQFALNLSVQLETRALAELVPLGAGAVAFSDQKDVTAPASGQEALVDGASVVRVRIERFISRSTAPERVLHSVANAHQFSAGWTRHTAAWNATALLGRLLRDIRLPPRRGSTALTAPTASTAPSMARGAAHSRAASTLPDPRITPTILGRLMSRYAAHLVRSRLYHEQWELALHRQPQAGGDGTPSLHVDDYRPLRPPADRFWADPFPLRVGTREFVLFEELPFATKVGHLSVVELHGDAPAGPPVPVLVRPYHLSYPFVFEHDGATYLIPETALEGRVELYRATAPPFEWTFDRVLLDEALLDATLVEIDGRWWMFAGAYEDDRGAWNTLVLYHAPSPFGPWTPHRRNPVVTDVRCARPAGRVFRHDGAWHRPAQDCSESYGGAMTVRRIVRLDELEYEEVEVAHLSVTESGVVGPHTLNAIDGLHVIDRKRLVRRQR